MRLVKFFSNLNYHFIGYFDPYKIFLPLVKVTVLRNDLSDNSAQTATLGQAQSKACFDTSAGVWIQK